MKQTKSLLLSTRDAVKFLGIDAYQVRTLAHAGHIEHEKTEGGHLRFSEAQLKKAKKKLDKINGVK